MKSLQGIRVLDASHVVAGPFASYQLALMGADVVRIDRIMGADFVRHHGGTARMIEAGLGASFVCQNAGKACIQLDLKSDDGVNVFKRLAASADIVIENFRPGVMDRLGLGYSVISQLKPDIIYASLTGYGPDGPLRDAPAYDHIVQGVSGLMSTTGTPQTGPLRSGIPITDYLAGFNAVIGLLAALCHRHATGQGQHVEISMLASALPVLGAALADYQTTGYARGLMGNQPFSDSPFAGRFDTSDGQLVVTANTTQQATAMLDVLGITSLNDVREATLAGDALFGDQRARALETLRAAFATDTSDAWVHKLTKASVPAGPVAGLGDVLSNPQLGAFGNMDAVALLDGENEVAVPGLGFRFASEAPHQSEKLSQPETAGASTRRVLEAAGFTANEIAALAERGAVAGADL